VGGAGTEISRIGADETPPIDRGLSAGISGFLELFSTRVRAGARDGLALWERRFQIQV
jgi:hypothetical protein